jgi:hypothetical protein
MAESKKKIEWNENFESVKTFAAANKRWPSTTSKDETEKELGQWWSRQKYLLNHADSKAKLSDERSKLLSDLVELNSGLERDGVWDRRYTAVADKFKADNKLWPYATENKEEQKNIRWWNQQKTFARKFKANPDKPYGGMTQERFDKVAALMRVMGDNIDNATVDQPAAQPQ